MTPHEQKNNTASLTETWYVIRQDTHGNLHTFASGLSRKDAVSLAQTYEDKGHHQGYWASKTLPKNVID